MIFRNLTFTLSNYRLCDFKFDWSHLSDKEILIGLFSNERLVGLVSFFRKENYNNISNIEVIRESRHKGVGGKLLAIVMLDSFHQASSDGYVDLISKTNGVEKFYMHLGATKITHQHLFFDSIASQHVIDKYLSEGGIVHE